MVYLVEFKDCGNHTNSIVFGNKESAEKYLIENKFELQEDSTFWYEKIDDITQTASIVRKVINH